MTTVTRRGFIERASMGAAAAGALIAVPGLTKVTEASAAPALKLPHSALAGPVVAHVRDFKTGEIAVMVGTREVVYRDPEFVARLLKAAQ
jgi:hypothetical protein